jgi:hypothetical protein
MHWLDAFGVATRCVRSLHPIAATMPHVPFKRSSPWHPMALSACSNMGWLDASLENERTLKRQRQVESRELPELLGRDQTRLVSPDRTHLAFGHTSLYFLLPLTGCDAQRQVTRSTERLVTSKNYTERSRAWPNASDRHWTNTYQSPITSALVAHLGSENQTRPIPI